MKNTPAKTPQETIAAIVANSKRIPVSFQPQPPAIIMDADDAHKADAQKLRDRIAELEKCLRYCLEKFEELEALCPTKNNDFQEAIREIESTLNGE